MGIKIIWIKINFILFFIWTIFFNIMNTASANPDVTTPIDMAPIFVFINIPINGFFYTLFLFLFLTTFKEKIMKDFTEPFQFISYVIIVIIIATIFSSFIDYLPFIIHYFEVFIFIFFLIFLSFLFLTLFVQRIKMKYAFIISFGMGLVNIISCFLLLFSDILLRYFNIDWVYRDITWFLILLLILFIVFIFILYYKFKQIYKQMKMSERNGSLPVVITRIKA